MSQLFNILVFILLTLTFGVQEFIPPIEFAQQARVLLPPVFFFAASLSVSFPVMLFLALFTGLLWDARHLPYKEDKTPPQKVLDLSMQNSTDNRLRSTVKLHIGYSIFLFGVAGTLMQGIRPLFKRGRWELPVIMIGLTTFLWLFFEFILISFLRGSFEFHPGLWTKLGTDTLLAMLVSPPLLFALHMLARVLNYEVRNESLVYRTYGS
ncbi:hypothetical protein BH11VER1_BH11VER1_18580 [soil metagenome]